jgi:hypothetical protein
MGGLSNNVLYHLSYPLVRMVRGAGLEPATTRIIGEVTVSLATGSQRESRRKPKWVKIRAQMERITRVRTWLPAGGRIYRSIPTSYYRES